MKIRDRITELRYGLELSANYTAVILQRLSDLGLEPKLTA